jgi:hypothetical protein
LILLHYKNLKYDEIPWAPGSVTKSISNDRLPGYRLVPTLLLHELNWLIVENAEIPPEILRVVLLKDGEIFADGDKETVLTGQNLSVLYDQPIQLVQKQSWYQAIPG